MKRAAQRPPVKLAPRLRAKIVNGHTIWICRLSMQRPAAGGVETGWGAYHFFEDDLDDARRQVGTAGGRGRRFGFGRMADRYRAASSQAHASASTMNPAFQEKAMLDDTMTRRRMGDLEQALKMERAEARKVSMQLLVASFNPLSNARAGLKARHNALVKLADETQSEIERRRPTRS
jgi:hypothetical protein